MSDTVLGTEAPATPAAPATTPVTTPVTAAPAQPAQTPDKAAPAEAAADGDKTAADKVADFVAKKATLLGDDPSAEKPAEDEKKDEVVVEKGSVPEKYDVKVPEGMTLNAEALEAVTPVFKELGITQEAAQKLIDAYAPVVAKQAQAQHEAAMKSFDEQIETWGKETREMLGPDAAKAMAPAAKFINSVAGKDAPALRQLLNDTGMGNHPVMVRFLINAGKSISQDSFSEGGNPAGNDTAEAAVGRMYPSMAKK